MTLSEAKHLVKSKQRVADHGEVFTPEWIVEDMLDLIEDECTRIDARILEPACGSGNFLVPILGRKLAAVQLKHGESDFEKRHYALFALMCIYGIELLADNAQECRNNLADVINAYLDVEADDEWARAARVVLDANIIQGDALSMTVTSGEPINFPEWSYLGKGKFQRRDFRYDDLTQRASYDGTLFGELNDDEVFTPTKSYSTMSVNEITDLATAK